MWRDTDHHHIPRNHPQEKKKEARRTRKASEEIYQSHRQSHTTDRVAVSQKECVLDQEKSFEDPRIRSQEMQSPSRSISKKETTGYCRPRRNSLLN